MEEVDIVIIGAGVIGLAVATEFAKTQGSIFVLEKNTKFGQETSSRNSEVVHAGMYYPSGSMKAKMCVEGKKLLYQICENNNIPYRKTGKLIVATEKEELASLEALLLQGRANGVEGLRLVAKDDLRMLEPSILGVAALYSEVTGIVDSHNLMQYFVHFAKDKGAEIVYNCEVQNIDRLSDGYRISIRNGAEFLTLKSRVVVNCAGLDSDVIAEMVGIDIKTAQYELHYCKGQYFRVSPGKAKMITHLVYPVPKPKGAGLGIHATLDLAGGLRLGPDDRYLNSREKDYSVDENKKQDFYLSVKNIMPFIDSHDLYADTAGIRPKLQKEAEEFRDFVISDEADKGFPGFINLIGIESPGLTACLAIAKYVKELLR